MTDDNTKPDQSAETLEQTDQPIEPAAEDLPRKRQPGRMRRAIRKFSLKWFLFRVAVYGIVLLAVFIGSALTAVKYLVEPEELKSLIQAQVAEQTGGRIDIASLTFDVLSGITLSGVQFYPPKTGDTRGSAYGGEVEPIPLANFDALDVRYSIPRIFAGRIHLNALKLVNPELHLKNIDGTFNFDSILAYRAVKFPPAPETSKEPEVEQTPSEAKGLPISPALLYLPFDIMAQNIGIENLRVDLIGETNGQISQIFVTNGLSVDLAMHWQGLESNIGLSVISPFEKPFEIDIKQAPMDENGELSGPIEQQLLLRTAMTMRLEIQDLQRVGFDYAMRATKVETAIAGYEDVGVYTKIRLALQKSMKGIDINLVDIDLADALNVRINGAVAGVDDAFSIYDIKLNQDLNINLNKVNKLAAPFVSGLQTSGTIALKDLRIEGEIDPAGIMDPEKPKPLPFVAGTIWLEDVAASYPGLGVTMEPIAGSISLAAGPAIVGVGSQVDLSVDLGLPSISISQDTPVGLVNAGVENLNTKITGRFLWPAMIAPILKVNVEAEHVKASGPNIASVDTPMYLDIDGDGRQDLERMGVATSFELTGLAELSANVECQSRCKRFRINTNTRLDSLSNLHAIVTPLAGMFGAANVMPSKMEGTVDVQFGARGSIPDPLTTPPEELLRQADVRFNTQLGINKVNVDVPIKKIKVREFETRVLASGDLVQQKIEISQEFEEFSLDLSGSEEPNPVRVERFAFDLNVVNDIDGPVQLDALMKQLTTSINQKIFIGRVEMKSVLPRPISDLQLETRARQVALADIELSRFRFRAPDFGSVVEVTAETRVDEAFMPRRLNTKVIASIDHSGEEKLPAGIKTSGKAKFVIGVKTDDMKIAEIDGEGDFRDFNVMIPGDKVTDKPILQVEGIRGQVPLKQIINIEKLMKPKPSEEETVDEVDEQDEEEETNETLAFLKKVEEETAEKSDKDLSQAFDSYYEKTEDKLLKNTNVVALVDYGSIRPFYPEKRPLAIEKLEAANLELSKMEFDIELRQNWFALNQFMINFLGGKIQGDFQLAFEPDPNLKPLEILKSVRVSLHMTRLDTRQLIAKFPNLKGKTSSWGFSNPYIDATVHFKFDPKSNDMSGGIEISSIGKEQLKMILYYVDPYEKNPTIAKIRSALTWGEVQSVSIPLKNGEIGMDVDVVVLEAPIPTPKLTRFPISQLIDNFIKQTQSGAEMEAQPAQEEVEGEKA